MRIVRSLSALASVAAVCLGGIAVAVPAAAVDASDTVIINCVGKKVVKPKEIVFTCADAGIMVDDITWTSWTANRAKGRGTLVWNTCLPTDCAAGIVQEYRARITLGRVASAPNVTVFSRMTLAFPNGGPAGLETGTLSLPNEGS